MQFFLVLFQTADFTIKVSFEAVGALLDITLGTFSEPLNSLFVVILDLFTSVFIWLIADFLACLHLVFDAFLHILDFIFSIIGNPGYGLFLFLLQFSQFSLLLVLILDLFIIIVIQHLVYALSHQLINCGTTALSHWLHLLNLVGCGWAHHGLVIRSTQIGSSSLVEQLWLLLDLHLLLLHEDLLLLLLHLILLLDLLFQFGFLLLFDLGLASIEVVLSIVVIAWMLSLHLLCVEVVVPDLILRVLAWLPRAR